MRRRVIDALLFVGLLSIGALLAMWHVHAEVPYYSWDLAVFQDLTLDAGDAFGRSAASGVQFVRQTLSEDRNALFALPLLPWVRVLGEQRIVFVLALYATYFAPFWWLGIMLVRRIHGASVPWGSVASVSAGTATLVAGALGLMLPAGESSLWRGYPDIGGAMLLAACVLVCGRCIATPKGAERVWLWVAMGVLAGAAVLLRRHYVYGVLALYGGLCLDGVAQLLGRVKPLSVAAETEPKSGWGVPFLALVALSALSALVTVHAVAPHFISGVLAADPARFAPWEQGMLATGVSLVATVGSLPLLLALWGWLRHWPEGRTHPEFRLLGLATLVWVLLWSGHARQQAYHYPHWLPLFVVVGLSGLWLRPPGRRGSLQWLGTRVAVAGVAVASLGTALPVAGPLTQRGAFPLRLLPDPLPLARRGAERQMSRLVSYLRGLSSQDQPILVAASSAILNPSLLEHAERFLVGRHHARLQVLGSPLVDTEPTPTGLLLRAQFVVTALPFQHHLAPGRQKVVAVLLEALQGEWPIAQDFERLPAQFWLGDPGGGAGVESGGAQGVEIRVYRRRQPSSPATGRDTRLRIERFVRGEGLPGWTWVVDSSPFPAEAESLANGTTRLIVHPTHAGQKPPTQLSLEGFAGGEVTVSGALRFFDGRCRGAELVAVCATAGGRAAGAGAAADAAKEAKAARLGVFVPHGSDSAASTQAFSAAVICAAGERLVLAVRHHPETPGNIDYCTVEIQDLRVTQPGMLARQ